METKLDPIPADIKGVYLWTFEYKDGYLVYIAGKASSATSTIRKRVKSHTSSFKNGGDVYVLQPDQASKGVRVELWPWQYSKNKEEFEKNKSLFLKDGENQLLSMRIFVANIPDSRLAFRMEAALMYNIYCSKEPWADLADRGMNLTQMRFNSEIPIEAKNIFKHKIYGLPETLEI